MMTAGLMVIIVLGVSLVLMPHIGMRVDGWGGLLLGAGGIAYCFITDPGYIVLVALPLSLGLLVIGSSGLVFRKIRGRRVSSK